MLGQLGAVARCGDEIEAMLTPHEEVVTGSRFAPVECAFLYEVAKQAEDALRRHPDREVDDWDYEELHLPFALDLVGHDRVGVLVCSREHGELWIGFDNDVRDALRWGTNATELQAATGVLAGWSRLGDRVGKPDIRGGLVYPWAETPTILGAWTSDG